MKLPRAVGILLIALAMGIGLGLIFLLFGASVKTALLAGALYSTATFLTLGLFGGSHS